MSYKDIIAFPYSIGKFEMTSSIGKKRRCLIVTRIHWESDVLRLSCWYLINITYSSLVWTTMKSKFIASISQIGKQTVCMCWRLVGCRLSSDTNYKKEQVCSCGLSATSTPNSVLLSSITDLAQTSLIINFVRIIFLINFRCKICSISSKAFWTYIWEFLFH